MPRYAWLEQEDGKWHFLTSLFADPADSTRKWSDRQCALEELIGEGWKIVRPYPKSPLAEGQAGNSLFGYGLIRTVH
jgi:hypothetical protein